jgi:hypothetical protein
MVVAIAALVVAASVTAVAATQLVSGGSLIKKNSLSGDRLRNRTVQGNKIKLSSLGTVPSATHAISADSATNATNATSATSAAITKVTCLGDQQRHATERECWARGCPHGYLSGEDHRDRRRRKRHRRAVRIRKRLVSERQGELDGGHLQRQCDQWSEHRRRRHRDLRTGSSHRAVVPRDVGLFAPEGPTFLTGTSRALR